MILKLRETKLKDKLVKRIFEFENRRNKQQNKQQSKKLGRKELGLSAKKDFYYMLYFFMESNLPMTDALDLLEQDKSGYHIQSIKTAIQNGERLAVALQTAGLTDSFISSCLILGENSGSYKNVLSNIVDYLNQRIEDRNYFIKIISYPLILVALLLFVSAFLIYFLTPSLYTTFESMNIAIPLSLKVFHGIYAFTFQYRFFLLMLFAGLISLGISGVFHNRFKNRFNEIIMKNKIVNKYLQPFLVRSILWQLHILTSAGIGLNTAIGIIKDSDHFIYSAILSDTQARIAQGFSLSDAWTDYEPFFSRAVIKYIKIGETTGHLQDNLKSAVTYMEIRCSTISERIKQIMQPALVLIAGAAITLLLILVLPIINSATSFGGI